MGKIVPVILSGGSGTRLWPLSREALPKQFLPLLSDRSLLHDTLGRVGGGGFAPPIVVCNREHRFLVAEELCHAGIAGARIVLEPEGRNSAPAIAAAALLAAEDNPNAVLCMMPADATIADVPALHRALAAAARAAKRGRIVTIGIQPTRPETGYGYIELGRPIDDCGRVFSIARFIEKPDAGHAADLVASGNCLWNAGMFAFTAATLEAELQAHAPEVLCAVAAALAAARREGEIVWLDEAAFAGAPAISLDYAVAERTGCGAVVPADLGWSDIGSWDALWQISAKDGDGNTAAGDVMIADSRNCYVRSDGALTTVVGLEDAIVVTTPDAVLVMHRDQAQAVKDIVARLRRGKRAEAAAHHRVRRPWGYYESLAQGSRFQVKRILVNPGAELSLQKHFHRAEHWVVVHGSALVTRDSEQFLVSENESAYLPLGCIHQVKNPGRIPLVLIEVQSGSYLGEDDIVRLEDRYGRA
jgi:mannose-1-phosphate guanylyltransferase/mannose-6-phosphate isomerase